jgi:hypothetical protein
MIGDGRRAARVASISARQPGVTIGEASGIRCDRRAQSSGYSSPDLVKQLMLIAQRVWRDRETDGQSVTPRTHSNRGADVYSAK